jgi:hypothetical protein
MDESGKTTHFFLSANTPQGFISELDRLYKADEGWTAYILKGCPGAGKSDFLKKTGGAFLAGGHAVEFIHCTCDYRDIDAVAVPGLKVCVLDGTAPHTLDPEYPGAVENIVNLGDCWDETRLQQQRDRIVRYACAGRLLQERACRYLSAAASLLTDTRRLALEYINRAKIDRYAARIVKREFGSSKKPGTESIRFLTAVTPEGLINLGGTVLADYRRVYVVEDELGISGLLLGQLRAGALAAGLHVITCPCPLFPDDLPEHLLIPSLSLAFVTSRRFHRFEGKDYKHIHVRRFVEADLLRQRKARLSFNRRAVRELLGEAVKLLGEAQANYEIMKGCYTPAMNYSRVEEKLQSLLSRIGSRP